MIKGFFDFLTEQEKVRKDITVLIVTEQDEDGDDPDKIPETPKMMKETLDKLGIKNKIIFDTSWSFDEEKLDDPMIHLTNIVNGKKITLDPKKTICPSRFNFSSSGKSINDYLQMKGAFVFNSTYGIEACSNKWRTITALNLAKIPQPKSVIVSVANDAEIEAEETFKKLQNVVKKELGNKFPIICKLNEGTHGIGVSKVDSIESLISVVQSLWKLLEKKEVVLQEYVPIDGDIRVIVIGHDLCFAMLRKKLKKDFRTNVSLGSDAIKHDLTDEERKIAINASKAVRCFYCGVDLAKNKETGEVSVLETNSSPGSKIGEIIGVDILKTLFQYILKNKMT